MTKKFKRVVVSVAIMGILTAGATSCLAASWGSLKTVDITAGDGWKNKFDGPYDTKEDGDAIFKVYSTSMTMTSNPTVRLINSDGVVRSKSVTVKDTYREYKNSSTAEKGHNYWTQIKPAWNQIGTDSIRYQINAM